MDRTDALVALGLVAAGIIFPGILNHLLHRAGLHLLGKITWVSGMFVLVVGAWVVWLRDVELTGPIE